MHVTSCLVEWQPQYGIMRTLLTRCLGSCSPVCANLLKQNGHTIVVNLNLIALYSVENTAIIQIHEMIMCHNDY